MGKFKINPIDEYLEDKGQQKPTYNDLFEADIEDVDIKTELTLKQVSDIAGLKETDDFINEVIGSRIFQEYTEKYMRLLISLNRQSRKEFVEVNKSKRDENEGILDNLKSLGR